MTVPLRGEVAHLPLAPRERQVLAAVVETGSRAKAASRLGISVHTVRSTLAMVYAKTGTHGTLEALRTLGYLDPREVAG